MVRKTGIYTLERNVPEHPDEDNNNPATFEEAISATGFGKFHFLLLLICIPANWATMINLFNTAFIIPALQCDFQLNIMDIGILNAAPFVGTIPGAFLWGYWADTKGRKRLMIYGTIADAVSNIICAFSVNMWMIVVFKCVSGFAVQGTGAILMAYISECYSNKYRSRIILISGIFMGSLNLFLPLLAWSTLPLNINYVQPWRIFVILCTIPSIITCFSFIILPESPKFLMMKGEHNSALKVFQKIYSMNTQHSTQNYPIKKLICENKSNKKENKVGGLQQMKPLFFPPFLWKFILTLIMQFFILLGANTLKTWLPELFSLMDDFDKNKTASLCYIITDHLNEVSNKSNTTIEGTCIASQTNDQVYINLCIVGICSIVMYIIVTILISLINKKIVLGMLLFISGSCGLALIWCTNPIIILLTSALYATMTGVACVTLMSITVDIFPTSFRTLTISLSSTTGRTGSIVGNLVFPALLKIGCFPPFFFLGGCILACIFPLILLSSARPEDF